MGPILQNGFNDWITDVFRCLVNLVKLWNVKIGYDIRKEFIQNFAILTILSPSTIVIFSFEIILFDNSGLATLQSFLLSQTFFSFKLLKYSLLLFGKIVIQKFICLVYLTLFSSALFLRKMFLSFVFSIIALDKFLFIKRRVITSHILLFTRIINLESYYRVSKSHQHPSHSCFLNFVGRFFVTNP